MESRDLLPVAIRMAVEAHGSSIGKDGTPYILHPLRLMMKANGYDEQIVAVLHDTIEDTSLTLGDLEAAGFSRCIVDAVAAVTKRLGEDYDAFLERISLDSLAVGVKLLDLYDNIDVTRLPTLGDKELQHTAKYHRAIARLERTLNLGVS